MSRTTFDIVIDAQNPALLARFWAAALNSYAVRGYDQAELERLAARGLNPDTDDSVAVDGSGPTLWFQKNLSPSGHGNLHLDLKQAPRAEEQQRLEQLGATLGELRRNHTLMFDPEGNRFCLFDP